jgi:hypothetical protein
MSDTVPGPKKMLLDIPSEVVLEYLLPVLSLKDLTSLSAVNRHYYALCVSPKPPRHFPPPSPTLRSPVAQFSLPATRPAHADRTTKPFGST